MIGRGSGSCSAMDQSVAIRRTTTDCSNFAGPI